MKTAKPTSVMTQNDDKWDPNEPIYLRTRDGSLIDITLPDHDHISIEEIACALSKLCRWNGQTHKFISVAEHSVLLAKYFMSQGKYRLALLALFHDASESFVGDVPTPLKRKLPIFNHIEGILQAAILKKFKLDGCFSEIKDADYRICRNESIDMFNDECEWLLDVEPLCIKSDNGFSVNLMRLAFWGPGTAEAQFLNMYSKLKTLKSLHGDGDDD